MHDRLARKLIASVILISTLLSLITSAIQIYLRYRDDVRILNANFDFIDTGFKASIEKSIWYFNFNQLEALLDGIYQQKDIDYIRIDTTTGQSFSRGVANKKNKSLKKIFDLTDTSSEETHYLGTLEIEISLESANKRLWDNIWVIFVTNSIKTFLISFVLLALFYVMVGRHLLKISQFLNRRQEFSKDEILQLNRPLENSDSLNNISADINALLTRVKTSHEDLDKTIQTLTKKNEQLERFAFISSHDLREPLRTIMSYSALLKQNLHDSLDSTTERHLRFIVESGNRMHQLLDDLLSYTKIDHEMDFTEEVDMKNVFNIVLTNLDSIIKNKNAVVETDDLPHIKGNKVLLVQVMQNLISNGLKYQTDGNTPLIKVSATHENGFWTFCISDNGIGIERRFHDRIFEAFRRLHTREKYDGTGIGLAICAKIIDNMGGRIWVDSEEAKGSHFYFSIPISSI